MNVSVCNIREQDFGQYGVQQKKIKIVLDCEPDMEMGFYGKFQKIIKNV